MATRDAPFAPGTPCWVDLFSSDPAASKAFYGGLFGWTSVDAGEEYGGYVTFSAAGQGVAGMMGNDGQSGRPDVWSTYISTADIDKTVALAAESGGQVISPTMQVADLGSMAMLADPAGAVFGVWQPGKHIGFTRYNEPASVTWDELHSKDFGAAMDFYVKVFGWHLDKMSDSDEFRYYLGQVDGLTVAGLMDSVSFLPPEVPSHWEVYFDVTDVDGSIATVLELGGTLDRPAEDTPYGRMAAVTDPTGAMFKLLKSST
jgi:predicted enzyme related to lactoylglutathione lyase